MDKNRSISGQDTVSRPNILIFNPDEMRADLMGHLGCSAGATPNIDAFVRKDAVSFGWTFCQNPVCVPSRCCFMTGLYPHVFGHRTMEHPVTECKPMLQELREAGYHVWMNNRNDFIPNWDLEAFKANADVTYIPRGPMVRRHDPDPAHPFWSDRSFMVGIIPDASEADPDRDEDSVNALKDFLLSQGTRSLDSGQPFAAFLGLFNPHPPYGVEKKYYDRIDPDRIPARIPTPEDWSKLPSILKHMYDVMDLSLDEDDWKEMQRIYLAMTLKVDDWFGQIIDVLKQTGQYDNTDIWILSDHGDFAGNYGLPEKNQNTFQDCLTRVPLIVKPHAGIPCVPGVRTGLTELTDFYATVMDLAGVYPTHSHFGKSLTEALANENMPPRSYVYAEGGRLAGETHCSENNSPVRIPCYIARKSGQADDVKHTKATMIRSDRFKYVRRLYESDEFYDLQKDPYELDNRIDDPAYAGEITAMRMQMLEWYQETCDIVPKDMDGRKGSPLGTLIENDVAPAYREAAEQLAKAGGITIQAFEHRIRDEGWGNEQLLSINVSAIRK